MHINVTVQGVTPLICNKFSDAAAMAASSGSRGSSMATDRGDPHSQAEKKLYLGVDQKTHIIPSPNLFAAIMEGGRFFKNGKRQLTTNTSSMIPSCVSIIAAELPISSKKSWCVDTRAVRIPSTGGRILAHRPIFNDWELKFVLDLDTNEMNEKLCRQIIDAAGSKVGLGDFRPARKGPFGRFVVTSWKADEKTK